MLLDDRGGLHLSQLEVMVVVALAVWVRVACCGVVRGRLLIVGASDLVAVVRTIVAHQVVRLRLFMTKLLDIVGRLEWRLAVVVFVVVAGVCI